MNIRNIQVLLSFCLTMDIVNKGNFQIKVHWKKFSSESLSNESSWCLKIETFKRRCNKNKILRFSLEKNGNKGGFSLEIFFDFHFFYSVLHVLSLSKYHENISWKVQNNSFLFERKIRRYWRGNFFQRVFIKKIKRKNKVETYERNEKKIFQEFGRKKNEKPQNDVSTFEFVQVLQNLFSSK